MTSSKNSKSRSNRQTRRDAAINRIADRIDLAIDVLTLGQYGLEQEPPPEATGCEGISQTRRLADRKTHAQPTRRRGHCAPSTAVNWDWPPSRDALSS